MASGMLSQDGIRSIAPIEESDPERSTGETLASLTHSFASSEKLIRQGFFAAVLLSMLGFAAVVAYLFYCKHEMNVAFTSDAVSALHTKLGDYGEERLFLFVHLGVWQYALQSCGVMAGVVFGFLGLALFLLGIQGDINGKAKASGYTIQLNHLAPGTLVIVASAILIGICATRHVTLEIGPDSQPTKTDSTNSAHGGSGGTGAPAQVSVP
jgi:hypothetical protein